VAAWWISAPVHAPSPPPSTRSHARRPEKPAQPAASSIPCAWLDELPPPCNPLAAALPDWIKPHHNNQSLAGAACLLASVDGAERRALDGCVLVSGEPRLLQSGLNAGLWTIGLASCGSLCGMSPENGRR
jgi:hypothetical protein